MIKNTFFVMEIQDLRRWGELLARKKKRAGVESRVKSDLRFRGVEKTVCHLHLVSEGAEAFVLCTRDPEATSIALRFTLGSIFALETCVFPRF